MDCMDEELASGDFGVYVKIDTNSFNFTNGQNLDFIPANPVCNIDFMCSFNHVTGHPHQTHLHLYSHSFIHLNLDTH